MKNWKSKLALLSLLCLGMVGCRAAPEPSALPEPTPASAETETPAPERENVATLYVGTRASGFQEYELRYDGDLTAELLIQGIADLTGWDLTLGAEVTSGKGGMSVCLADSSALYQGPPEVQKDEFHMYSADQLAETILDSIQKTLQKGFTGELGDPDNLDVWYYMENGEGLTLPNIGLSWSLDQPYQWAGAKPIGETEAQGAREAALDYYAGTVFAVSDLIPLSPEEVPSWEGDAMFKVLCSKGGEPQPERTIALAREGEGWKVLNEGY